VRLQERERRRGEERRGEEKRRERRGEKRRSRGREGERKRERLANRQVICHTYYFFKMVTVTIWVFFTWEQGMIPFRI
jgi:cell division septal protein FtsQ